MMRIPWVENVRSDDILKRAKVERELFELIKTRKISNLGHILRGAKYKTPQFIFRMKIEGWTRISCKQLSWLRNIKQWTGIYNNGEVSYAVRNRMLIMNVMLRRSKLQLRLFCGFLVSDFQLQVQWSQPSISKMVYVVWKGQSPNSLNNGK